MNATLDFICYMIAVFLFGYVAFRPDDAHKKLSAWRLIAAGWLFFAAPAFADHLVLVI